MLRLLIRNSLHCQYLHQNQNILSPLHTSSSTGSKAMECKVSSLDHLVLTVTDMEKSIAFYTRALGMTLTHFGEGRKALQFGNQKINLHKYGQEFKPHAKVPTCGSADLCFVTKESLDVWVTKFQEIGIPIEEGPVQRTGAVGPMTSVYVRDPDANLIEIAFYKN